MPVRINPFFHLVAMPLVTVVTAAPEPIVDDADGDRDGFASTVISMGPQLGYHERPAGRRGIAGALFSRSVLSILVMAVIGLIILADRPRIVERNDELDGADMASADVDEIVARRMR